MSAAVSAALPLLGAVLGLIAGSFLATLVLRWPEERTLGGRSACDGCGATLGVRELIPLLSWAWQRGRCRCCGAAIDPLHPAVELMCAAVGASAFAVAPGWAGAFGALFGWLLVALAALDLRWFWLPDRLTLALAVLGLSSGAVGVSPLLLDRMTGGAAAYASLALLSWGYQRTRGRSGLGGGDPKLFGAIGLWLGWQVLPYVLLGASVVGLIVAGGLVLAGRAVSATTRLPFGTLLAAAAYPAWLLMR